MPAKSLVLGDNILDDGYDQVPQGATFALSGGDRRIEVVLEHGYPAVQIFAPRNDNVVCIEPMAAPPTHCATAATTSPCRAGRQHRRSASR